MRLTITTALLTCAGAAWLFTAAPAEAQQRGVSNRPTPRYITYERPRTRVTVQRGRSYLDPGTEVMPYSQHYTDYLFLNQRPLAVLGPGQTNDRQPFSYPWELGGGWRIP